MLGIYLKDVVEDEAGQEKVVKKQKDMDYEPERRRRQIQTNSMIQIRDMVKQFNTPKCNNSDGFDVLPDSLREKDTQKNKMFESLIGMKGSIIGTRYEAIHRARQNLSLIKTRLPFGGSNSVVFSETAIEKIEMQRPIEEPKSSTNKSSPISSARRRRAFGSKDV